MFILFLFLLQFSNLQCLENSNEFLLETQSLPNDLNFLPTLGNGQVGYTVFGDAIFMNGIYNGHAGDSRRARIPNWLNVSVATIATSNAEAEHNYVSVANATEAAAYAMNLKDGYFRWRQTYKNVAGELLLQLEQRTYAHRYYNRALIYELLLERTTANAPLHLKLKQEPGAVSAAFNFTPIKTNNISSNDTVLKMLKGSTMLVENPAFQNATKTIFIVFSDNFTNEKTLKLLAGQTQLYYRFIITADEDQVTALQEMQDVLNLEPEEMLRTHAKEWHKFWQEFHIKVEGNLELAQTINAGIFYLASSLPAPHANQPNHAYFGLSPTGLGRGQLDADYEGHNFWDTEIWMLPAVMQLSTTWAGALLQYRKAHLLGAEFNAQSTGYRGARFPWESAYTGTEVTNPCCPVVATQEIHISPDICFALQQYFAVTNDRAWLCEVAWPLVREITAFLESRVELDAKTQLFHIRTVMGPDEDHANIDDNVYTNVVFKIALEFASFTQATCSAERLPNPNWLNIAKNMFICYDATLDYHPQHFGYERHDKIKQADVALLGYPLQYTMKNTTRLNDLNYYVNVTRPTGPAMTWSMFAINFLDVHEVEKANFYFVKGYKDYVRPEFKVWSETTMGNAGSVNFLTGIGGFLQAIINGYGGIRFYRISNKSIMQINPGYMLPETNSFTIKGLKFADAEFSLQLTKNSTTLSCLKIGNKKIELILDNTKYQLYVGFTIDLLTKLAYIETI